MHKLFILLLYLIPLAMQSLGSGRLPLHIPAFIFSIAGHYVFLYHLNNKLALPLALFEKSQQMIAPLQYYRYSMRSHISSGSILSCLILAAVIILPLSAPAVDAYLLMIYFIMIYTLLWTLYDSHNILGLTPPDNDGPAAAYLQKNLRRFTLLSAILYLAVFFTVNWKLGESNALRPSLHLFVSTVDLTIYFIAPKLFFWLILTVVSLLIWWKFIQKREPEKDSIRRMTAFYLQLSALFLSLAANIQATAHIESRITLLQFTFANLTFLLLAYFSAKLMTYKMSEIPTGQYAKYIAASPIHFSDSRHHAKALYLIFSAILAFLAFNISTSPVVALLFLIILIIPAFLKK